MIRTEQTILAIAIEYPELRMPLVENCKKEYFASENSILIFDFIKKAVDEGRKISWVNIFDELFPAIDMAWLTNMQDCLKGIGSPIMAGREFEDYLATLKDRYIRKPLEKEINKEINARGRLDFKKISDLAQEGIIISCKNENGDPRECLKDYLAWRNEKQSGVFLGISTFDNLTDSYYWGEIISIIARTTAGKTFLAINILNNLAESTEENIGFFSLEMAKGVFWERIIQTNFNLSRLEVEKERLGNPAFNEKMNLLLALYAHIKIYGEIYSPLEISKIVRKDKLKIIFIDYLQLMKGRESASPYERASFLMREIKQIAKEEKIIIFLMVQLSREAGAGWSAVTIDMCRDSGAIEENSDFIIGLWDPNLNPNQTEKEKEEFKGYIAAQLLKNKRGPTSRGKKLKINEGSRKIWEI
jgi:replicative DNA helicase